MNHADRGFVLLVAAFFATQAFAAEPARQGEPVKKLVLPGEALLVEGHPAFIFQLADAAMQKPQPWVLYAPTLPGYPDEHEKWMHEQFVNAGVAVAGIDIGESFGMHGTDGNGLLKADIAVAFDDKRPMPCLHRMSFERLFVQFHSQAGSVGRFQIAVREFERLQDEIACGTLTVDAVFEDAEVGCRNPELRRHCSRDRAKGIMHANGRWRVPTKASAASGLWDSQIA